MMMWIKGRRKDGKYTVVYGFSNGVRLTKIVTSEQAQRDAAKAENRFEVGLAIVAPVES